LKRLGRYDFSNWITDEFLRRDGGALLRYDHSLDPGVREELLARFAKGVEEAPLGSLSLESLLTLANSADHPSLLSESDPIRQELLSGRHTTKQLVEAAQRPMLPRARALLLMVIDQLGVKAISFSESDPAAEYYQILWDARRGSETAAARLRQIFIAERKLTVPIDTRVLRSWALSNSLSLEDLLDDSHLGLVPEALDPRDLLRVTRSISPARRMQLIRTNNLRALTKMVAAKELVPFLDCALSMLSQVDGLEGSARNVIARVPASALLAHVLPTIKDRSAREFERLIDLRSNDIDLELRISLSLAALGHPNESVRKLASAQLLRDTGSASAWLQVGEEGLGPIEADRFLLGIGRYGLGIEIGLTPPQRVHARRALMELGAGW
jgi:hypothetical protein